jgi:hypothetical protein
VVTFLDPSIDSNDSDVWQWSLSDDLTHYIITTLFEQPRLDSSALIRGSLPHEQVLAWLLTGKHFSPISLEDHGKFRRAAKSRGGNYSMELCEFAVEEVLANGDLVLNFWRRVRDDTGEGGRIIVSCRKGCWEQLQQLGGWENRP